MKTFSRRNALTPVEAEFRVQHDRGIEVSNILAVEQPRTSKGYSFGFGRSIVPHRSQVLVLTVFGVRNPSSTVGNVVILLEGGCQSAVPGMSLPNARRKSARLVMYTSASTCTGTRGLRARREKPRGSGTGAGHRQRIGA